MLSIKQEFVRFVIAGVVAFLADFCVLVTLTEAFGISYLVGNVFGFAAGLLVSYQLSIRWVFTNRRIQVQQVEFLLFSGIALLALGINEVSLWALVELAGIHYASAKIVANGTTMFVNFLLKKWILFPT